MKRPEDEGPITRKTKKRNERFHDKLMDRISSISNKMSRGASNIFRGIKTRCAWGNKQLWWKSKKEKNTKK